MAVSATAATTTVTDATLSTALRYSKDDGRPVSGFRVRCDTGSAVGIKVRIPWLHGASGTGRTIAAGEELEYLTLDNNRHPMGHELYIVAATAGTGTYSFEVIA
jgi:hypothetical protein